MAILEEDLAVQLCVELGMSFVLLALWQRQMTFDFERPDQLRLDTLHTAGCLFGIEHRLVSGDRTRTLHVSVYQAYHVAACVLDWIGIDLPGLFVQCKCGNLYCVRRYLPWLFV